MAQINQLSAIESPSSGDQLPLFSTGNGDARKMALSVLAAFLADGAMSGPTFPGFVRVAAVTVANLPSPVTAGAGARAVVSDANATTFNSVVAGGGANILPVFSTGSAWRIG
jgi:hypothetical protein